MLASLTLVACLFTPDLPVHEAPTAANPGNDAWIFDYYITRIPQAGGGDGDGAGGIGGGGAPPPPNTHTLHSRGTVWSMVPNQMNAVISTEGFAPLTIQERNPIHNWGFFSEADLGDATPLTFTEYSLFVEWAYLTVEQGQVVAADTVFLNGPIPAGGRFAPNRALRTQVDATHEYFQLGFWFENDTDTARVVRFQTASGQSFADLSTYSWGYRSHGFALDLASRNAGKYHVIAKVGRYELDANGNKIINEYGNYSFIPDPGSPSVSFSIPSLED